MDAFVKVSGIAVPLRAASIDTDVIMPKQFLKGVDRSGLKDGLFHDLRFDEHGASRPDFILNRPAARDARFLIVGPNFGCGSSREHAVWGLMQHGIRALIGTSFAGIFFDNCARNGLLAISLDETMTRRLMDAASRDAYQLTVDLDGQRITGDDIDTGFEIDPLRRNALLNGLDAIGQTLSLREEIMAFEAGHLRENPWLM